MIRFNDDNWNKLRANYKKFWEGNLGRPILPIIFWGCDPGRPAPPNPTLAFSNVADLSITPEQIIDRFDFDLSCCEWGGDGYPIVYTHAFGPGVAAAFMGCEFNAKPETVWFDRKEDIPIKDLHFEYDPDNIWFRRVKDIYIAGVEKWGGEVLMAQTDLGGILDILASFRTSEQLLYELYDEPEEVLRCVNELQVMWFKYYDEIHDIIAPYTQGYSAWAGIYSERPSYMLQCDFCYMIGPEMFDKFVAPELKTTAARLDKPFYHLDGIGELPHLQTLLNTETIYGIQWVCGSGEPENRDWKPLYKQIEQGGKKIQAPYNFFDNKLGPLLEVIKPDTLVTHNMGFPVTMKEDVRRAAYKYGLEI